ncbi:hypothetical protein SDC9_70104 [bioreactor metagenome]|uniref:Rubrerythrin diiron-binding domain-containing protein n=1 Tax=bioreactor metagenome TaxID=1076179 RepID=A0A644Y5B0_9ZZZZ
MNTLDYAIEMESDGEKYYEEQAKLNENSSVKTVCLILARDEGIHAQILQNKMNKHEYKLIDTESYTKIKSIFKNAKNFKSEIRDTPTQLEFYRTALEKEKQSIDLYTDLLANAADIKESDLFKYLIEQETRHFSLLDEMVAMLRHAEEWVESAEFGLRKETY